MGANKHNSQGITLAEVLVSLVILSLGLAMAFAALPVVQHNSEQAVETSACASVAASYFSILRSLGRNATLPQLKTVCDAAFSNASVPPSDLQFVEVLPPQIHEPPGDTSCVFDDGSVLAGMEVRIAYCDSTDGAKGRAYSVAVRRKGGRWHVYPLLVCE
ncbi:MAG: prepilin-type N-terminal cleavage/methylation domain-containing protein [Planctomycetota bacterium]|nr:prepilin-type N-terminal cleavage/methylation domain-containing protein [Planctomycetota bacterium]